MQANRQTSSAAQPSPLQFLRSIQFQILLPMLVLGLLPLILIGAISAARGQASLQDAIQDGQAAIVQSKSQQVAQVLQRWAGEMDTLSTLPSVVGDTNPVTNLGIEDIENLSRLPGAANSYLDAYNSALLSVRAVAASDPSIELVYLLSTGGEVLLTTREGEASRGTDLSGEAHFTAGLQGLYFGQPFRSESGDARLLMHIAHPITRGALLGVAVIRVNLNEIEAIMGDRTGLGETGETYLVDQATGLMLTQSRFVQEDSRINENYQITTLPIQDITTGESDRQADYSNYLGDDVIGSWRPLNFEGVSWLTIGEISQNEGYAPVFGLTVVTGVVTLLVAAGIGVVAYLLSRVIANPIRQMTETAQRIAAGNLQERVAISSRNEVGALAQTFNSMTAQLSDLIDTLEERVANRTRDLQVAADVSRQVTTFINPNDLLPNVVELTRSSFNLYFVAVFLYNSETRQLRLAAASGEIIDQMPERDKQFDIDSRLGLVPLSAKTREAVVANDVLSSKDYLPNALLPETRSAAALPMIVGTRLIGVLDLQSEQLSRFSADDLRVLTTLAEQIGIAVRNAQLFVEVEQARQIAEDANKVKSQFLANMSHELRTPLNAILNFTEIVADGVLGDVNEKQVDALQKAVASGDHLLSLINDVLDITKIEVGMMELFIEEVDMNAVIKSALSTAHGLLKNKPQVELVTDIDPDLPTIRGDKRRLRQVLINLISNAVKFTPSGTVSVTVKNRAGEIFMSVADTGVGIAEEDLPIIFETFRQTRQGLADRTGTGLGLPISRHFAEAHGGKLWVESKVDVGSTFYVVIPVDTKRAETLPRVPQANGKTS